MRRHTFIIVCHFLTKINVHQSARNCHSLCHAHLCHVHFLGDGDGEGDGDGKGESDGGGDGDDSDGYANGSPPTDRLIASGFLIEQMQRKRGGATAN